MGHVLYAAPIAMILAALYAVVKWEGVLTTEMKWIHTHLVVVIDVITLAVVGVYKRRKDESTK